MSKRFSLPVLWYCEAHKGGEYSFTRLCNGCIEAHDDSLRTVLLMQILERLTPNE